MYKILALLGYCSILFIAMIVSVVLGKDEKRVWAAMASINIMMACSAIAVANMYFINHFWLVLSMYRYHRYEFFTHYKRQVGLMVTTYGCMSLLIFLNMAASTSCLCVTGEYNYFETATGAFYDVKEGKGYCSHWVNGFR